METEQPVHDLLKSFSDDCTPLGAFAFGAVAACAGAFPAAAAVALVYRFPIPFRGYESGLDAVGSALIVSTSALAHAQVLERLPNIYPLNGLPDPYAGEEWVELPDGRTWGSTATSSPPGAGSDPAPARCARRTPWTSILKAG
jgi:hypothetical protein